MSKHVPFMVATLIAGFLLAGCATSAKKPLTPEEHAHLLVNIGNGSLLEGNPTAALEALLPAEQLDPQMPEVHQSLALAYYTKGDTQTALKEALTAVQIAPSYADANNTLGKIYLDLGRYNEAVAPLLKAAQSPLYVDAYKSLENLGILYYRKGDLAKAGDYFTQSINTNRDASCVAFYYRGHLSLRAGNYADAIENYKQATKNACGGFADAHLAIGITYERERRFDMARKQFVAVEQQFPDSKASDEAIQYLKGIP